jgi:PKD repeat protein
MYKYRIIITPIFLIVSLVFSAGMLFSNQFHPEKVTFSSHTSKSQIARLDSDLSQLVKVYELESLESAHDFARRRGLSMDGNRVQVTLYTTGDHPEEVNQVKDAIMEAGGEVQTWWRAQVQGLVPISSMSELAKHQAVRYIRNPLRGHPDITSEGIPVINADDYSSAMGTSGEGVKVAILDRGFDGVYDLQASGELPSDATLMSFRADGIIDGITVHGTACAEIVYDIAPDATYYMVSFNTDTEFLNAVDWLESEEVNVISNSNSFFNTGAYDGSSDISQRIATARSNGILWTNSGGNSVEQHWEGTFENDGSGFHVWDSGSGEIVNSFGHLSIGTIIRAFLSWNNWDPYSTNDYDLCLKYRPNATSPWEDIDVCSTADQSSGGLPPTEEIIFETTNLGIYGIQVQKVSGSDQYLEIFTPLHTLYDTIPLTYSVPMSSVQTPSDSTGAISVGAVDVNDYSESGLEHYSSHGPTNSTGGGAPDYNNGSRTKPDIAGPTRVSTASGGIYIFWGTSAATPHTAGAAVLYMSGYKKSYGSLPTADQTQEYLENCAESTNDWGTDMDGIKNNQFGAGGLYMCEIPVIEANFSASPTEGDAPLIVNFTNLSTGDFDTCSWDFGDGGTSSDCNDPEHTYWAAGTYSVSLTVSGDGGEDTETKTNYITVYEGVHADFSASPTSGIAPLAVSFTNLSSGDFTTCGWDFGDGGTSSDCSEPVHIFHTAGTYTVSLTVSGDGGEDTETKTDYINVEEGVKYKVYLPMILKSDQGISD